MTISDRSAFHQSIRFLSFLLTSVRDDSQVGSDDLHVNAMLLFSNENCSPESPIAARPLIVHFSQTIAGTRFS